MTTPGAMRLLSQIWAALGGRASALDAVQIEGRAGGLPSVYAVAEGAAAQVGAATLAVAELLAARTGAPLRPVRIDRQHAAAAFRSERYLRPIGWERAQPWDPIAGDYETSDGWIRLHTNYAWHREPVLRVLAVPGDRAAVSGAVRVWQADALESAVVQEGGCAAAMRDTRAWALHPQGSAVAKEPLVQVERARAPAASLPAGGHASPPRPLEGIRILDLTRVIAGPVCTRFLAAFGGDVLRIDPPGFEEVPALLSEVTAGKRRAALDLHEDGDRRVFERLVAEADVLVGGYRSDALARLGYSLPVLRKINAALIVASIDAYGWTGPWSGRRGFDSLVQMSCGIAARGAEAANARHPVPLPAQALDHGTGYLLAAAVCCALHHRVEHQETSEVRLSLARTAQWLVELGEEGDVSTQELTTEDAARWTERADTFWGPVERVRCPGVIDGVASGWTIPPGPLGADAPTWSNAVAG